MKASKLGSNQPEVIVGIKKSHVHELKNHLELNLDPIRHKNIGVSIIQDEAS